MTVPGNSERRTSFRRRALMGGTLRYRTQPATHSCVVRDISTSGARLVMTGAAWLPENFELEIRHRDLRVNARAVWRKDEEIGIEFLSKGEVPFRSARAEDRVRVLEIERQKLQLRIRQLSEEL